MLICGVNLVLDFGLYTVVIAADASTRDSAGYTLESALFGITLAGQTMAVCEMHHSGKRHGAEARVAQLTSTNGPACAPWRDMAEDASANHRRHSACMVLHMAAGLMVLLSDGYLANGLSATWDAARTHALLMVMALVVGLNILYACRSHKAAQKGHRAAARLALGNTVSSAQESTSSPTPVGDGSARVQEQALPDSNSGMQACTALAVWDGAVDVLHSPGAVYSR